MTHNLDSNSSKTIKESAHERENNHEYKDFFRKKILEILLELKTLERNNQNFLATIKKLDSLAVTNQDKYVLDRSWSQENIDELIGLFEEFIGSDDIKNKYYSAIGAFRLISTSEKKEGDNSDTVSDLFARSIVKRIIEGEKLSYALQEEIGQWCDNIHMINSQDMLNFVTAILNNPGIVHQGTRIDMIDNIALYGLEFVSDFKEQYQRNSGNVNSAFKIAEVLHQITFLDDTAGFSSVAHEASILLEQIYNESDNYFLRQKIASFVRVENFRQFKEKFIKDYNENNLQNAPEPLESEVYCNKSEFISNCIYSKLSGGYYVIYNQELNVDSFIAEDKTSDEVEYRRVTLKEILEEEGLVGKDIDESKLDNMILAYQSLISPPLRKKIEDDFGINLSQFSIRTQLQFLNFLTNKTEKEVEEVINFVKQGYSPKETEERVKSFLTLELGGDAGESILKIGKNSEPKNARKIFAKIAELTDTAEMSIADISRIFYKINGKTNVANARYEILKKARELIIAFENNLSVDPGQVSQNTENILAKLERISANIMLIQQIVKELPREEVADLDLKEIPDIEMMENYESAELLNNEKLLGKILSAISKQFPKGDAEVFLEECKKGELTLTITLANGELISFFTEKEIGKDIVYFDWFISNPDAPIKGLGEATVKTGMKTKEGEAKTFYAVAKPYVKSFALLLEKLGFAGFGEITGDSEYKHHYARCRKMPADLQLKSKNIDVKHKELFLESIQKLCREPHRPQTLLFDGYAYDVCRIEFSNRSHEDDITEMDEDGWIYSEIARQTRRGLVLARFIPESTDKNNQTYYAVFEKSIVNEQSEERFLQAIHSGEPEPEGRSDHSTSKKALSM